MGNSSMKVKDLISKKGHSVITIGPNESVNGAIKKLVENNIGALPVCDSKGALLGIVSERDLLSLFTEYSQNVAKTRIKEVMTTEVVICNPEDELVYVMDILAQKGIRHLPVVDTSKLVGILSIRDIVDAQLRESKATVRLLTEYISGSAIV